MVPWQRPPPANGPVALNASGPADGMFVTPGVMENVPVGAAGVPAQVHTVVAPALAAPPSPIASRAPVAITMPMNFVMLPPVVHTDWSVGTLTGQWQARRRHEWTVGPARPARRA